MPISMPNGDLSIDLLDAENAELFTINQIVQTGKVTVSGELLLRTPVGGQVVLDNSENDFNLITIESGHSTGISLTDANDLLLGNWDMIDSSVTLRSVGAGATIRQLENTNIAGDDSSLTIYAANIDLGADGTASISLGNIGSLENYFEESLTINGRIQLGGTSSYLAAEGTDDDNRITIGEFADVDITSIFEEYLIDLKGGNDIIELYRDFAYGFFTGAGEDQIYLVNSEVNYNAADFDSAEDEVVVLP